MHQLTYIGIYLNLGSFFIYICLNLLSKARQIPILSRIENYYSFFQWNVAHRIQKKWMSFLFLFSCAKQYWQWLCVVCLHLYILLHVFCSAILKDWKFQKHYFIFSVVYNLMEYPNYFVSSIEYNLGKDALFDVQIIKTIAPRIRRLGTSKCV